MVKNKKKLLCFLVLLFGFSEILSAQTTPFDSIENRYTKYFRFSIGFPTLSEKNRNYHVVHDFSENYTRFSLNIEIQQFINSTNRHPLSLNNKLSELNESFLPSATTASEFSEKSALFALIRNDIIFSENETRVFEHLKSGVKTMYNMGYTSLENDFLPFINMLMEEQYLYHYDYSRIAAFGAGAKGTIDLMQFLHVLQTNDRSQAAGVCRDTHDAGLRLLSVMAQTYYDQKIPNNTIDFDKLIFIQSWTTDRSQHMTVSMIDPENNSTVYELDWGRTLIRKKIQGYDHGRNYGNTYRMWQFNSKKDITEPIDFKRTQTGLLLDDKFWTLDRKEKYFGIGTTPNYSQMSRKSSLKRHYTTEFSVGVLPQNQYFGLFTITHKARERTVFKVLKFQSYEGLQIMYWEDHIKKNHLFPINQYFSTNTIMALPRADFSLKSLQIRTGRRSFIELFADASIDVYLATSYFDSDNSGDYKHQYKSGDGSIFSAQGLRFFQMSENQKIETEIGLFNRSFPVPRDVRLMSPNPVELLSSSRIVSPAQDFYVDILLKTRKTMTLRNRFVGEYTNLNTSIISNTFETTFSSIKYLFLLKIFGMKKIGNIDYFWYPTNNAGFEIELFTKKWHLSSILNTKIDQYNSFSISCGFVKYFN